MVRGSYFGDMMQTIADRGRRMLGRARSERLADARDLGAACEALLSGRGEASGVALAREILAGWRGLDEAGRRAFLIMLAERFGPDHDRLERAIEAYRKQASAATAHELHLATEPRRQELIRRLNLAPGGTQALVRMRETLEATRDAHPDLAAVDADFAHLLSSWFNRGFLVLQRIDWSTPANILEKIIRYEAVHAIDDWEDLRRRLEPSDRRCFAFFHPQLVDEPLIFVEVALMANMPATIAEVLAEDRVPLPASEATTAVFYSISNTQRGLRGISFGSFLIKQVVEELRRELPRLTEFVTLSPVPGFARWLERERGTPLLQTGPQAEALARLDGQGWHRDSEAREALRRVLPPLAARYFLKERTANGRPHDAVARFHLGNGARLERINFLGDVSPRGMREAHGLMVNYRYKLDDIEKNHELFATKGEIVAAPQVRRLLRELPQKTAAAAPPVAPAPSKDDLQDVAS